MDEFIDLVIYNLNRIEDLVRRLFDHNYESAQDLWTIQTDLARYQIELRQKIRNEEDRKKQTVRSISNVASQKKNEWKATLQRLHGMAKDCDRKIDIYKHALMLSKQFGDAFAWIFLKGDSRKIAALAINEPNPSIPEGLTLEAMLGVAEGFANGGAGFPLIHDVTNCLRVGDLTFCNLLEAEDEPLTVEVKSKVLKTEGDIATLQVAIYAPAVQPKFEKVFENIRKRRIDVQEKTDCKRPAITPTSY